MCRIPFVDSQRGFDRVAHNGMKETGRVAACQNLETNQPSSDPHGAFHAHPDYRRGVAKLAAVAEHGEGLGQAEGLRIQASYSRRDLSASGLAGESGQPGQRSDQGIGGETHLTVGLSPGARDGRLGPHSARTEHHLW